MTSGKRIFPVILFLSFFLGGLPSGEAVIDRVVAVVNQEIITLSEVERGIGPLYEQIRVQDRLERQGRVYEARRKILEQLVEEKLLDQEAKRLGFKVSAKEMESALEEIKNRNRINQEELEVALRKEGFTLEAFRKQIEKKILRTKLVGTALKVEPNPGEKELKDFFQKNVDQYREMESYRPGHILFQVPQKAGPDQVKEIRKKCERVLE